MSTTDSASSSPLKSTVSIGQTGVSLSRTAGVLLHITSLPGPRGMGDLGPASYKFLDELVALNARVWQMLPTGPTGYGHSPYQALSSFAGSEVLVSLDDLASRGWLDAATLVEMPATAEVDFDAVLSDRLPALRRGYEGFLQLGSEADRSDLVAFCEREAMWLDDYVLFRALKDRFGDVPWNEWPADIRSRRPEALAAQRLEIFGDVEFYSWVQYVFDLQWRTLKAAAADRGILLIGDLPIFTAHDSADVWARPDLFLLNDEGAPNVVAGVPPDYFSETGQRWGNPLYDWSVHKAEGYAWWVSRMKVLFDRFDGVRVDHFRGFAAFWEIPAHEETAMHGQWIDGPGAELFHVIQEALPKGIILAEDLGLITDDVHALRDELALPGMRVLQFCFGDWDAEAETLPRGWPARSIAYSGTHDNETLGGWLKRCPDETNTLQQEELDRQLSHAQAYAGVDDGEDLHWPLVQLVLDSPSVWAIFPLQDLLELGAETRMNTPGTTLNNWNWRARRFPLPRIAVRKFAHLVARSGRSPS